MGPVERAFPGDWKYGNLLDADDTEKTNENPRLAVLSLFPSFPPVFSTSFLTFLPSVSLQNQISLLPL